jgi:hypothetical protein
MIWVFLSFFLLYLGAFWGYGQALKDSERMKKRLKK